MFLTAEQLEIRLKSAQDFLKRNPPPPRKDPKDVVQCASTQRLLSMTEEELIEYRNRKIDLDKAYPQGLPNLEGLEGLALENYLKGFTGTREVSAAEIVLEEDIRRKRGNYLGQVGGSSVSEEKKEAARQAFTCTPPAELSDEDKERLAVLNKITEYKGEVPKESKPGLLDKLSKWLKSYAPTEERRSYAELQEVLRKEKK